MVSSLAPVTINVYWVIVLPAQCLLPSPPHRSLCYLPWAWTFLCWATVTSPPPSLRWFRHSALAMTRQPHNTAPPQECTPGSDWALTPSLNQLPFEFWQSLKLPFTSASCSVISDSLQPPMDCSPPGSSVHGILQARRLEWVAVSFSNYSSPFPSEGYLHSILNILAFTNPRDENGIVSFWFGFISSNDIDHCIFFLNCYLLNPQFLHVFCG